MGGLWDFWVDRGGTFTDVVARRPDGTLVAHKLLSVSPAPTGTPPSRGSAHLLGVAPGEPLPADQIGAVRLGTTVATNALLERKGERSVLVITAGLPGRAADRLPEPAAHLRPAHRAARPAVRAGHRGPTSGSAPAAS